MKAIAELDGWRMITRLNRAGNLTVEIERDGELRADVIFQANGVIDLGTTGRPWPLGEKGWDMPGAPSRDGRKFRFGPEETVARAPLEK